MLCSSANGCSYLSPAPCVSTRPYLLPNTLPVLINWEKFLTGFPLKLGERQTLPAGFAGWVSLEG